MVGRKSLSRRRGATKSIGVGQGGEDWSSLSPRSAQERRKDAAERRSRLAPLRKEIKAAEAEIARIQSKMEKLDAALADPDFFLKDAERASKFVKERAFLEKKLAKTEQGWLELSAEYEGATTGA